MNKIALTAMAIAALGVGACQRTGGNNAATDNAAGNHSDNASGEADGHRNVQTVIENGLDTAGNGLSKAGDVIESAAGSAINKGEEVVNDIADGPDGNSANKK